MRGGDSLPFLSQLFGSFHALLLTILLGIYVESGFATSEYATFHMLERGNCSDHGLFPIISLEVCAAAARSLHMGDISPIEYDSEPRPEGCHYKYTDSKPTFPSFNANPANKGIGSQAGRRQICSSIINATMANTNVTSSDCHLTNVTFMTEEYLACLNSTCTNYNFTVVHELMVSQKFGRWFARYPSVAKCVTILGQEQVNCSSKLKNTKVLPIRNEVVFGESFVQRYGDLHLYELCPRLCGQCHLIGRPDPVLEEEGTETSVDREIEVSMSALPSALTCSILFVMAHFI